MDEHHKYSKSGTTCYKRNRENNEFAELANTTNSSETPQLEKECNKALKSIPKYSKSGTTCYKNNRENNEFAECHSSANIINRINSSEKPQLEKEYNTVLKNIRKYSKSGTTCYKNNRENTE